MRVALFTDTYLPSINGVTNTIKALEECMKSRGIEYSIFAPEIPKTELFMCKNVRYFKSVSFPLYPEFRLSVPFYSNLIKKADNFNPDIVHSITQAGIGYMGIKYASKRNLPIVSSFTTDICAYLEHYNMSYVKDIVWNYLRWFHNNCDLTLCPSHSTINLLKQKNIYKLGLSSRGVDSKMFSPMKRSEHFRKKYIGNSKKMLFLYAGRIAKEKSLDILMEAIKKLDPWLSERCSFIIVGDGPYYEEMKKAAPKNVHFTGYFTKEELSEAYASCDSFIFPSATETFGNVVLEAMSSGLPAICVNSGGVKEIVKNGYNGILSPPYEPDGLVKAINFFYNNPLILHKFSENARKTALSKSWDNIFSGLLNDYSKLIPGRKILLA